MLNAADHGSVEEKDQFNNQKEDFIQRRSYWIYGEILKELSIMKC